MNKKFFLAFLIMTAIAPMAAAQTSDIVVTDPVVVIELPEAGPAQGARTLANFLFTIAVITLPILLITALPFIAIAIVIFIIWKAWKKKKSSNNQ